MTANYNTISNLINEFRVLHSKDSITPESLGFILQSILNFANETTITFDDNLSKDLGNLLGKPYGIAPLAYDAKVSESFLPNFVMFFAGIDNTITDSKNLLDQGEASYDNVFYNQNLKTFIGKDNSNYFSSFIGGEHFGIEQQGIGYKPYIGKLFYDINENEFYHANERQELVLLKINKNKINLNSNNLSQLQNYFLSNNQPADVYSNTGKLIGHAYLLEYQNENTKVLKLETLATVNRTGTLNLLSDGTIRSYECTAYNNEWMFWSESSPIDKRNIKQEISEVTASSETNVPSVAAVLNAFKSFSPLSGDSFEKLNLSDSNLQPLLDMAIECDKPIIVYGNSGMLLGVAFAYNSNVKSSSSAIKVLEFKSLYEISNEGYISNSTNFSLTPRTYVNIYYTGSSKVWRTWSEVDSLKKSDIEQSLTDSTDKIPSSKAVSDALKSYPKLADGKIPSEYLPIAGNQGAASNGFETIVLTDGNLDRLKNYFQMGFDGMNPVILTDTNSIIGYAYCLESIVSGLKTIQVIIEIAGIILEDGSYSKNVEEWRTYRAFFANNKWGKCTEITPLKASSLKQSLDNASSAYIPSAYAVAMALRDYAKLTDGKISTDVIPSDVRLKNVFVDDGNLIADASKTIYKAVSLQNFPVGQKFMLQVNAGTDIILNHNVGGQNFQRMTLGPGTYYFERYSNAFTEISFYHGVSDKEVVFSYYIYATDTVPHEALDFVTYAPATCPVITADSWERGYYTNACGELKPNGSYATTRPALSNGPTIKVVCDWATYSVAIRVWHKDLEGFNTKNLSAEANEVDLSGAYAWAVVATRKDWAAFQEGETGKIAVSFDGPYYEKAAYYSELQDLRREIEELKKLINVEGYDNLTSKES